MKRSFVILIYPSYGLLKITPNRRSTKERCKKSLFLFKINWHLVLLNLSDSCPKMSFPFVGVWYDGREGFQAGRDVLFWSQWTGGDQSPYCGRGHYRKLAECKTHQANLNFCTCRLSSVVRLVFQIPTLATKLKSKRKMKRSLQSASLEVVFKNRDL